ncbi:MAG: BACON domain-containing protein [Alistipes sp.]|nr:BACON domain-containing protein [Alistipes sp.]
MKRYITGIFLLAVSLFAAGCTDDTTASDSEREWVDISIAYTLDGSEVRSLPFNSSSRSVRIDVELNNQNLYWTVESDADWCSVVEETHRGNGGFTINIQANEEFSDRTPATLTFVAGQYRGHTISVTQSGNVFILNQIYAIGSKLTGSTEISVSVQEGVEWDVVAEPWLKAVKGDSVSENGMVTTALNIEWEANGSSSRYGSVGLIRNGEEEPDSQFNVFQFGDEMPYDDENVILLPSKSAGAFEIKVPARSVESVVCPSWITWTATDNADNTTSYIFTSEDNPSDTRNVRESNISLKIQDKEGAVALPLVKQEFYSVQGITSANGLKLFSQTVNAGGDTSDWVKDGKAVLLNNIDMSQLTGEWVPIGTAENPFTGVFDGRYRKIMNLTSSSPLFGVCEGAELNNIIIDESSVFVSNEEYTSDYVLAPLARSFADCTVTECSNYAAVTMNGTTGNSNTNTYVSGLVGRTYDGTTLSKCENYGRVEISDKCMTAFQSGNFYLGGIVASNGGVIEESNNYGALSDAGATRDHYIGGIVGLSTGAVRSCVNGGALSVSAHRTVNGQLDHCRWIYMGGIVARQNAGEVSGSKNDAPLKSTSDVKMQKLGGVIGYIAAANPVLADNTDTEKGTVSVDGTGTQHGGGRAVSIGGLYGELYNPLTFDFSNDKSSAAGAITCANVEPSTGTSNIFVGGLIGLVTMPDETPNDVAPVTIIKPSWSCSIKFVFSKVNTGMFVWGAGGILGGAKREIIIRDAVSSGDISVATSKSYNLQGKTAGLGGIIGYAAAGARISGCSNETPVQQIVECKKSNSYPHYFGGIVGVVVSGHSEITNCTNNAVVDNQHYNNNPYNNACNASGGIVGGYLSSDADDGTLKIAECVNTGAVKSKRGMAGGIIGYGVNADIENCENTGSMANGERSYIGGIAGVLDRSSVKDSKAVCAVAGSTAGSEKYNAGGICGLIVRATTLSDCSYFGNVSYTPSDIAPAIQSDNYAGGIVGSTTDGSTSIARCRFGGRVLDNNIDASNFSSFIVGTKLVTPDGCSYWDGK